MLSALGRHADAEKRYQEVVDRAGTSVYGQMAKLGKADAEYSAATNRMTVRIIVGSDPFN